MKFLKFAVLVLIGAAIVVALPAQAKKEGPGSCEKSCMIPNLTPEQSAKIQKLRLEHQKALLTLQTEAKLKRLDLDQLMMEGSDQIKLEAKIDELAKIGADIQKKCLAHRNEVRSLLTDEQKKAFNQHQGSMLDCGVGGHGRCGGDCGGPQVGMTSRHGHRCHGSCQGHGASTAGHCAKK